MFYRTLADFVALTHFAFIVFAICGGLLALRWRWVAFVHIPAAAWGVTVELFGWFCPLTPLENWLRRAGGSAEYAGGFIERYLLPVIYPEALTRELQIILGLVLVLINLGVYLMVWRRYKVRKVSPVLSRLLCVGLFATAMGFLEAICVVYLREYFFSPGTDTQEIVAQLGRFGIEHIREACTIVMLFTVAWIAAFNSRTRTAMFFLMFGIWDITYYIGLRVFTGWPDSILAWDCLFLMPVPWYGPVLAPVLISVFMVVSSVLLIIREAANSNLCLTKPVLALVGLGFGLWYWSFVKDAETIMASGYHGVEYSWLLFLGGLVCAVLGVCIAARRRSE